MEVLEQRSKLVRELIARKLGIPLSEVKSGKYGEIITGSSEAEVLAKIGIGRAYAPNNDKN